MNLTLRQPQPSDYEALASWVPDAAACLRWAGSVLSLPLSGSDLPKLLAVTGGMSYCLVESNATPYAFGQRWVNAPGAVHLGRIIVSPAVRGRRVGRALCEQLIDAAVQSTGANAVTLRVYRDNVPAVALYSGLGFEPVETQSNAEVLFMRLVTNPPFRRRPDGAP